MSRTPPYTTTDHRDVEVTVRDKDSASIVAVRGRIDRRTSEPLRAVLRSVLETKRRARIEVDCADVTFIDSSGLSALLTGYQQARARGTELNIRNPSGAVARLLKLTRLDRRLHAE